MQTVSKKASIPFKYTVIHILMDCSRNDRIAAAFDRLDKDGNGVLSPAEVSVVIKEQLGYDDSMAEWLVQMFDQNKDGSLDKTEFKDMWTSMFG